MTSKKDTEAQIKKKNFSSRQNYSAFRQRLKEKKIFHQNSEEDASESKPDRNYYWKKYRDWLWPYKVPLGFIFLMALLGMLLEMVLPWATKYIIDSILLSDAMPSEKKFSELHWIGAGVLLTLFVGSFSAHSAQTG